MLTVNKTNQISNLKVDYSMQFDLLLSCSENCAVKIAS